VIFDSACLNNKGFGYFTKTLIVDFENSVTFTSGFGEGPRVYQPLNYPGLCRQLG
jgi:hypothetical protein